MLKQKEPNLTRSSEAALLIAARDGGCVIAGKSEHKGRVERVAALTIKSLAAHGLIQLCLSPDGGMMGRLTATGTALAKKFGFIASSDSGSEKRVKIMNGEIP